MKKHGMLFVILALILMVSAPVLAADYDLVITNGRVMDPETMYDGVANVGVTDGRIAVITKDKISGTLVVADGKLVLDAAPGQPIRRPVK